MKITTLISILVLASLISVAGQKINRVNKYAIGLEIDAGHSFPNFDKEQTRWQGSFYQAGALTISFTNRINRNWGSDIGVGITGYALTNTGSVDNYTLDFTSPHLVAGISYYFQNRKGQEHFFKLKTGLQLGYQGRFVDEFEAYKVTIQGKNKLYPFIRPEIGIRRYFNKRMKGSRFKMVYEFGTYFRYNLSSLGTAKIEEVNFNVILEPRGNIIGGYFKILFPTGNKQLRIKEKEIEFPPIIYNPTQVRHVVPNFFSPLGLNQNKILKQFVFGDYIANLGQGI